MIIRLQEPLARHTAWRTGGVCEAFVVVESVAELARVQSDCKAAGWACMLVGAGTRTVFRDGGYDGVVVRLGGDFARIDRDGPRWRIGSAVPVPALVAAAADAGLTGLETLAGIPGSVGAALAAGEMPDAVLREVGVLRRGREAVLEPMKARATGRPLFTHMVVELGVSEPAVVWRSVRTRSRRGRSWFGAKAREDLDRVEARGVRLRSVAVARDAPETLVNLGGGTARDLQLLHRSMQQRVKQHRGVELRSDIKFLGRRAT